MPGACGSREREECGVWPSRSSRGGGSPPGSSGRGLRGRAEFERRGPGKGKAALGQGRCDEIKDFERGDYSGLSGLSQEGKGPPRGAAPPPSSAQQAFRWPSSSGPAPAWPHLELTALWGTEQPQPFCGPVGALPLRGAPRRLHRGVLRSQSFPLSRLILTPSTLCLTCCAASLS